MLLELLLFIQTLPPGHTLIPNAQYKSYINEKSLWGGWRNKNIISQENQAMLYNIIIITEIQFSGYEEPLGIARYVVKVYRMMFPYNVQFVFEIV